jgi:hypothetical protein
VFWDKDKYDFPEEKSPLGNLNPAMSSSTSCRKMMFELNTLDGKQVQLKSPSLGKQDQHLFTIQDQATDSYNKKTQNSLFKKGRQISEYKSSVDRIKDKIKDKKNPDSV